MVPQEGVRQSSVDSGVNSISAVVLTDFVGRLRKRPISPRRQMLVTRLLAIGIGLIVVLTSSFLIPHVPGNFVALANRITNLLISPLFLIFFMALFVPFSTRAGTLAAVVASMLTAVTVAYWEPLIGWLGVEPEFFKAISFQWIQPCALTAGIAVGCSVILLQRAASRKAAVQE